MKNFRHIPVRTKWAQAVAAIFLSQSLSYMSLPALADTSSIKIAGQSVFSINSAANAGTTSQRAQTVQENLDNALVAAKDRTPATVNIAYVKGIPVITVGGYQVITVNSTDAAAAHTTPALLANQWADKIRHALVDQNSVNSYVAQLSGSFASSAPPAKTDTARLDNNTNSRASNNAPAYSRQPVADNSAANNNYAPNTAPVNNAPLNNAPLNNSQGTYDSYNSDSSRASHYGQNPGNGQNPSYGQATGYGQGQNQGYYPGNNQGGPPQQDLRQGRVAYAQAGQIIPITLNTSIATQVARAGDLIQATVSQNVNVGDSVIPSGSVVTGQVTDAKAGGRLTHSGELQIKFNCLRLPDGSETPINAHISGRIGKYAAAGGDQSDEVKGETLKNKVGSVAFRGLLGTGGGAALGTAVGAIAGGGHGAGMGAWSGAAIGGGLGVADSLILRKGADVTIPSGTKLQLQLDSPVAISGVTPFGY